jgi:hypothetical protein
VSMTQKEEVWYEVIAPDEASHKSTSSSSSSSSSREAFWVEHRRSPHQSQQFKQQQKAHRPPTKRGTSVDGARGAMSTAARGATLHASVLFCTTAGPVVVITCNGCIMYPVVSYNMMYQVCTLASTLA